MAAKSFWAIAGALLLFAPGASSQSTGSTQWIESWGTAQPLGMAIKRPVPTRPSTPPPSAQPSPRPSSPMVPYPEFLDNQTVRMVVRISAGGSRFRLQFSNAQGDTIVTFGAVRAALAGNQDAISPASDRVVTFGGKTSLTLFPGGKAVSDPINLTVRPLTDIAVSMYVPGRVPTNTVHALGLNPAYIAPGDATAAERFTAPQAVRSYFWLSGLSVAAKAPDKGTIVAFGDSITDGYATTPGAHLDWPELLARRLQANPATAGWGVVNMGISGNRILKSGAGEAAVARFDADALGRAGVKWVILLEGINDINMSIIPGIPSSEHVTAAQIVNGLDQLVARAHLRGIKVAGATILPTKGLPFYSAEGETMRQTVNDWIRTSGRFDAVIDFDRATRDPSDPLRLRPSFDPGDHVHPNDAGNRAMADAIDLAIFH